MLLWNNIFPGNITAFTTDSTKDFSLKDNQNGLTSEQKKILAGYIQGPVRRFVNVRQIHGNQIMRIDEKNVDDNTLFEADGIITNLNDVALMVRTADCLPIYLYDVTTNGIGIVHAGWKGAQHYIASKAIEKMIVEYGSEAKNIKVVLGPCIQRCCYKVGEEFIQYFPRHVEQREGAFYLNLQAANRAQLLDSGIVQQNIFQSDACTCCDNDYHSFRRDADRAGRMISLILLTHLNEKYL